ncbi:alpha/beta family hydrolase [Piscibacillus salipiscarius]|uniref:alpha/beta family hydrolase n=1 Tax=Piscibacillus salipiscarius TaxID=299480 RepID=UPI0034E2E756
MPGAGYTSQAPLLYYSTGLFVSKGFDVLHVNYSYSENQLKQIGAEGLGQDVKRVINQVVQFYDEVMVCSKSLGTLALSQIVDDYKPQLCIWLTPLLQRDDVFHCLKISEFAGLVVIGDQDPCYIKERYSELEHNPNLNMTLVSGANHSLELQDKHPTESINILKKYLAQLEGILNA